MREKAMTQRNQIYKCMQCGNMIEVLHASAGELSCCGQPMRLLYENTTDAAVEKHLPVLTPTETGFNAAVGSVAHPMEEKHYIEWIEVLADGRVLRQYLSPGEAPAAVFCLKAEGVVAREYCNLHGLWRS
jgi:superoxide reductase